MNRDKVKGLIIGGAIGDAWGMPVETWSPEKILEVYPDGVHGYKSPIGHKWFTDDPECEDPEKTYMEPGFTTDDTQLTRATLIGLIEGSGFDMDKIAEAHLDALKETTAGWGKSTIESIRRIGNGVHWSKSGKTNNAQRGTGNGIPMKCSPLAAFRATLYGEKLGDDYYQKIADYAAMTHFTDMAVMSGIIHCEAVLNCLRSTPENFCIESFMLVICNDSWDLDSLIDMEALHETDDRLEHEFIKLFNAFDRDEIKNWDRDKIIFEFGAGSCYVKHSLPFSYAFFCKYWEEGVVVGKELVNAGGDTDTNAKIGLELIGALHGMEIFEREENKWMIEGLSNYDSLVELVDDFCDQFGVA